jgi:hypothetical protein
LICLSSCQSIVCVLACHVVCVSVFRKIRFEIFSMTI